MSFYESRPEDVHSEAEDCNQSKTTAEQESACVLHEPVERPIELFNLEARIERIHGCVHGEVKQSTEEESDHENFLPHLCGIVTSLVIFDVYSFEYYEPYVDQVRVVRDRHETVEEYTSKTVITGSDLGCRISWQTKDRCRRQARCFVLESESARLLSYLQESA